MPTRFFTHARRLRPTRNLMWLSGCFSGSRFHIRQNSAVASSCEANRLEYTAGTESAGQRDLPGPAGGHRDRGSEGLDAVTLVVVGHLGGDGAVVEQVIAHVQERLFITWFTRRLREPVVALESAFHFAPRAQFFEQAYEVLLPGGVLAMAVYTLAVPQRGMPRLRATGTATPSP